MGIESVPCDCASLGTVLAMIGLFFDQYGHGVETYGDPEGYQNDYSITCRWNSFLVSNTTLFNGTVTTGESFDYNYDENNCDNFQSICSNNNDIAGKVILGLGIAATFFAIGMMLSQQPKFEAPKTWGFRIFLLFSGAFYIGGATTWFNLETCNNNHIIDNDDNITVTVSYGISFWFVAIGGFLNFIGGMFSFINPTKKIKRKKRRTNSMGNINGSNSNIHGSNRTSARGSAITTPHAQSGNSSPRARTKED